MTRPLRVLCLLSVFADCGSSPAPPGSGEPHPVVPGTPVAPALSDAQRAEEARVAQALAGVSALAPAELTTRYPAPFPGKLSYDPLAAVNLEAIQRSAQG